MTNEPASLPPEMPHLEGGCTPPFDSEWILLTEHYTILGVIKSCCVPCAYSLGIEKWPNANQIALIYEVNLSVISNQCFRAFLKDFRSS